MRRCRSAIRLAVGGAWIAVVLCGSAAASDSSRPNERAVVSTDGKREKPAWQPERPAVLAIPQPTGAGANEPIEPVPWQGAADRRRVESRPTAFAASAPSNQRVAQVGSVVGEVELEPFADQPVVIVPDSSWSDSGEYSYSTSSFGMDPPLGGAGDGCSWQAVSHLQLFGGVHGFKGPTDQGRNGNFGFHEGLNFGAPLWDLWGYGYQAGFQALHSNFAGNQAVQTGPLPSLDAADRNQVFFTGGLFKRPLGSGWQTGVAFDVFYDSYYARSTLYQLRSETAYVLGDLREIGYWGAYGLNKETITGLGQLSSTLNPTDLFAVFYRRRFTGGGRGRLWAGLSGNGDAICGLDGTVPLGTSWALDNNFTWLLPKEGPRSGGQAEESWSVSIQLVWYPGRQAHEVFDDPYHPLFYVADNSWFLVDRRQ